VGAVDQGRLVADRALREVCAHRGLALVVVALQRDLAAAYASLRVGLVDRQLDAVPRPGPEIGVLPAEGADEVDDYRRARGGAAAPRELTAAGKQGAGHSGERDRPLESSHVILPCLLVPPGRWSRTR